MLTASELDSMRASLEELLPGTCNILAVTYVSDGMGGLVETWGTATAGVKCRMDVMTTLVGGREQVTGGAVQSYTQNMFTLPHDTSVTTENRIQYGGNTYGITNVMSGDWNLDIRVWAQKL